MVRDWRGMEDWAIDVLWKKVCPSLERGCLQFRVAVTHNDKAAVPDAVHRRWLLLDSTNHYFGCTDIGLTRSDWPHKSSDKGFVLQELKCSR